MSYDVKVRNARELIEAHNKNVTGDQKVDFEKVMEKVRAGGGTSESALAHVSYEDLVGWGVPLLIARQIASKIDEKGWRWRESDSGPGSGSMGYVGAKKLKMLSHAELFERLDLDDPDSDVAKKIKELSGGRRCVVLNETESALDVPVCVQLLGELKDGIERPMYVVDGKEPREVFKIGDRPNRFLNKNPIFREQALRPDDSCGETNLSWAGVDDETRLIIYLATRTTNEISSSVPEARRVNRLAKKESSEVKAECPKAVILLKSLQKSGDVPSMRISVSKLSKNRGRRNDPFSPHKTT